LFARWAGVSPKAFLRCLTLEHARQRLAQGQDVLGTSHAVGLSGPGRLHALCVTLEAASPGELKSGGAGLCLVAGFAQSPLGKALIAESPRGICHLQFQDTARHTPWAILQEQWPAAEITRDDTHAQELADRIFRRTAPPGSNPNPARLKVFVRGTAFQIRVWRALLAIPPGALCSYGNLARAIQAPGSARAVGSAVGRNAVGYLIPCHRVIRESGVIGQYRWGSERKQAAIAWESVGTAAFHQAEMQ
jgi:AraC family transcriptional regulator of adaptative response/methylated-DNA-[protein]-cysteine methyltransferase